MAVVQIHSGTAPQPPKIDPELIEHLETLLEHAKRGEVLGYCAGIVINGEWANWYTVEDDEWTPVLSYATRRGLAQLESDD